MEPHLGYSCEQHKINSNLCSVYAYVMIAMDEDHITQIETIRPRI